jgi:septal ring factor EnvC (AmiA/AmiB activator)
MPVKMQCRVLVTKNKFDEAYAKHGSHLSTERLLTKRLKNAKSELFEQHKNVMDGLQDGYLKTKQDIIDGHEKSIEEIENKLEDLRVDKNINEDQIRNLEEACNKQKMHCYKNLEKKNLMSI